jgi:hypothetical protein
MARVHAWELPDAGASTPLGTSSQRQWEESGGEPGQQGGPAWQSSVGDVGEADDANAAAQLAAGHEFAELLIQLNVEGKLSAKDTCLLSYWASRAGAQGPVADLAYRPTGATRVSSGHYQRHLDKKAGLRGNTEDFYNILVPGHTKHSGARSVHTVKVYPPHERLHKEAVENPALLAEARAQEATWPPSFKAHKVVRGAPAGGPPVIPLAFYLDGAQYTKAGATVLVFVVCNIASGSRHLVAVLKKKDMCRCGCRGWRSVRPIMQFLHWSFAALAQGAFPAATHEGAPWPETEGRRSSLAGLPLALVAAVQQVRGDWAEFAHSLGFPTWKHMDYPCLWCRCDRDSMYAWGDLRELDLAWEPTDEAAYEAACQRCEIHVTIQTIAQRDLVAALLFYDKKVQGSRGRALKRHVPELLLLRGDRLEPCPGLPDVGAFESLGAPASVVFWRHSQETITKHRNPLFGAGAGITIATLRVDTLHCLYLGVFQAHCSAVVWALIDADAWRTAGTGHSSAIERLQESCIRLQADLHAWSLQEARARPAEPLTMVQEFTPKTLGDRSAQQCRLKGGETKTLMGFLQSFLPAHTASVPNAAHMLAAGQAFHRHIGLLKAAGHRFTKAEIHEFAETQHVALVNMAKYAKLTPKCHQWLHCGRIAMGNQSTPQP